MFNGNYNSIPKKKKVKQKSETGKKTSSDGKKIDEKSSTVNWSDRVQGFISCSTILISLFLSSFVSMTTYKITKSEDSYTLNVIPAAIAFTGLLPQGTTNWNANRELESSTEINYLRGRKLVGEENKFNSQYKPVLFQKSQNSKDGLADCEYESIGKCSKIISFGHEFVPSKDTDQIQRLKEWTEISDIINE